MKNCTMNSIIKHLFLVSFIFLYTLSFGQVKVYPVKSGTDLGDKPGIFYALPQTWIKVDIVVNKTEYLAGPYAEFAGKYLDLEDVSTNDYNEFVISDVKLSTVAKPDPDNFYFVEVDDKILKENKAVLISLSQSGLASGINGSLSEAATKELTKGMIGEESAYQDLFQYFAETNLYEKSDTIIRKVVVDTISVVKMYLEKRWVEKSSEQKAVEAANKISKIRENRYNLITGYQEIPYEAGAISYMHQELKNLENEYMSLFTGITIEKTISYSFTVLPEPDDYSGEMPVCIFSERSGVKDLNAAGGQRVYVRFETNETNQNLISAIKAREQMATENHGFYYRIPATSLVTLDVNDDIVLRANLQIAQFGTVSYLPSSITAVQFYPETGGIKNLILEK
ncbi:MAG: DUF4831 family protein [Bacteroidales bacterium]|nr:DUF4831 family protein [Bacteroidales bacterium]